MSEAQQAVLPDPREAYQHLFENVRSRVFFNKLASYGRAPANEKEAEDLLTMAAKLRAIEESYPIKQAGDNNGRYAHANQAIDYLMADYGLGDQFKQAASQESEQAFRNLATQLVQDPETYNAVLSLKQAEADEIAASFGNM
jgi:hypothetical protein